MDNFFLIFSAVMLVVTLIFGTRQDRKYLTWAFGCIAAAALIGFAIMAA